jgi:hypothetical protein
MVRLKMLLNPSGAALGFEGNWFTNLSGGGEGDDDDVINQGHDTQCPDGCGVCYESIRVDQGICHVADGRDSYETCVTRANHYWCKTSLKQSVLLIAGFVEDAVSSVWSKVEDLGDPDIDAIDVSSANGYECPSDDEVFWILLGGGRITKINSYISLVCKSSDKTTVSSLAPLQSVERIEGGLEIANFHSLESLRGLDALVFVGGFLRIMGMESLTDGCALALLANERNFDSANTRFVNIGSSTKRGKWPAYFKENSQE